jgi:hypothetical protein
MREDIRYVHEKIRQSGGLPQINKAIELIQEHLSKEHLTTNGNVFTKKNYRLSLWKPTEDELYNLIVAMFTTALTTDYLTYQAMVGFHNESIPMENTIDRVQTIAEVTALICIANLIDIHSIQGEYHKITPCLVLKNIPFTDRHGTVYSKPQPVKKNWDEEQGNMILGGKIKHHKDKICLDHINRMNKIPMSLNKEFILEYPEEPKEEFTDSSITRKGKPGMSAIEKQEVWDRYTEECKQRYTHALITTNKLYLNHKPDTRGRIYTTGYYIDTQGSSYKKASIELYNKEYLNDK